MTPDSEGLHEIANAADPNRRADIVFVHGLGGTSHGTWRFGQAGQPDHFFWLEELGKDLPACGIWTIGYPAGITSLGKPGMIIEKRAGNLSQKLANAGLGGRPLVFIAHSMGGLVVKSLIVGSQVLADPDRKRLAAAVRGLVFCATPHRGSAFADAAGVLSLFFGGSQDHVQEMRANAEPLDILHDQFIEWHRNTAIPVESYAENIGLSRKRWLLRPVPLGLVVPRASANPGIAGHTVRDVDDDHLTLVKPKDRRHDVYAGVLRFVRETLEKPSKPRVAAPKESPAVTPAPVVASSLAIGKPRVYLSYTLRTPDMRDRVFEVAEQLRAHGIDSRMDLYYDKSLHGFTPPDPAPGRDSWDIWQGREIRAADRVLLFCSREYAESPPKSGAWRDIEYMQANVRDDGAPLRKFIPVGFGTYDINAPFIPSFIYGATYHDLATGGVEVLVRRFRNEFPATPSPSQPVAAPPAVHSRDARAATGHASPGAKRFDVAFSLASEQRNLIQPIADELRRCGLSVFFYGWPEYVAELATLNLDTHLRRIYGNETRLLVPVLSANYAEKPWTGGVELAIVRELILDRRGDEVMALRADDAVVPDFSKLHGYLDVRGRSPEEIASLITLRLNSSKGDTTSGVTVRKRVLLHQTAAHRRAHWGPDATRDEAFSSLWSIAGAQFGTDLIVGLITPERLQGAACLVLTIGPRGTTELHEEEFDAIRSFVREGGGLLLLGTYFGDRHHQANLSLLAETFGISFNPDVVLPPGMDPRKAGRAIMQLDLTPAGSRRRASVPMAERDTRQRALQELLLANIKSVRTWDACSIRLRDDTVGLLWSIPPNRRFQVTYYEDTPSYPHRHSALSRASCRFAGGRSQSSSRS